MTSRARLPRFVKVVKASRQSWEDRYFFCKDSVQRHRVRPENPKRRRWEMVFGMSSAGCGTMSSAWQA